MRKKTSKGQKKSRNFSKILDVAPDIKITCVYCLDYVSVIKAISISTSNYFHNFSVANQYL